MLLLVGIGMKYEDLTLQAIQAIESADLVIIDTYTSIHEDINRIIELIGRKEVRLAKRSDLEGVGIERIVEEAARRKVAILVPGDPLIATTHEAIRVEAAKRGVEVKVVNGLTVVSLAFSRSGLHFYKLGRTVTLTYDPSSVDYVLRVIQDNTSRGLHTLILLDWRAEESKAMTVQEAVSMLLEGDKEGLLAGRVGVGLARLGFSDEYMVADLVPNLGGYEYPGPPHSLIVTGDLHFMEVESLRYNCGLPEKLYERLVKRL
ncbi:diphthine synthase [Thermogladius calderae]|uniref:diphthine synthase n=1 Tax=Thermogladius calderae TaxID=1200300 RepID=UPI00064F0DB4|nr:diphthine synthase [Thermogladius calderae]